MSYTPPSRTCCSTSEHLAGIDEIAQHAGLRGGRLRDRAGRARGMRPVQRGRGRAAERRRATAIPRAGRTARSRPRPASRKPTAQYAEGGWQGLQHPAEFGGQGLPKTIGAACVEMLNSANLSFALCPLLTDGAIEALLTAGSDELKATYLEKLVSGKWTGTMNLTEPQAGSRPGAGAHPRRAAARRHLQDLRHQDLHHLRRARHGREHRAPGAGPRHRRARRRQGHQPVRGAEVHGRQGRLAGRAQRRALREHRAQAGHQGLADGGAAVRRPRRCRRATWSARRTAASSTCSS